VVARERRNDRVDLAARPRQRDAGRQAVARFLREIDRAWRREGESLRFDAHPRAATQRLGLFERVATSD
jgi:hypothetical protein